MLCVGLWLPAKVYTGPKLLSMGLLSPTISLFRLSNKLLSSEPPGRAEKPSLRSSQPQYRLPQPSLPPPPPASTSAPALRSCWRWRAHLAHLERGERLRHAKLLLQEARR